MAQDPMAEIRASFFDECEELLEALHDGLIAIEQGAADTESFNLVFRAVHSIKGGAGAFGLLDLVKFAHHFENLLDSARRGDIQLSGNTLATAFAATDLLSDLVTASRDGTALSGEQAQRANTLLAAYQGGDSDLPDAEEKDIDFQPLGLSVDFDMPQDTTINIDARPPPPSLPRPQPNVFDIRFAPQTDLFETGNEPALLLRNLLSLGNGTITCHHAGLPPLGTLVPEVSYLEWQIVLETEADAAEIATVFEFVEGLCTLDIVQIDDQPLAEVPLPENAQDGFTDPAPPAAAASPNLSPQKTVVRVDLERIEALMNLVGELVINQAMLNQALDAAGLSAQSGALNRLEEFQRLTRDIQDTVMTIRAQPVKPLFQRMSRIVREVANVVGKDVRLITRGEHAEVDKTVIEHLSDPLTHMIRNAVDHGLENRQDRITAGKPAEGMVTLTAAHKSGRLIISVSDDGAGINRSAVLQKAILNNIIPPDADLSDEDIDNLLFHPGLSTAATISDLSGRGVGMDVVRAAIQAIGGRISITSEPGKGTCFTISLPLTLAVLDAMIIQVAQESLVLPLSTVVEAIIPPQGGVHWLGPKQMVLCQRDCYLPLCDLGAALGYRSALQDLSNTIVLVIAHEDGAQFGIIIDNIVDQRQVVIKGLDTALHRAPGIVAATILGDGNVALILDPTELHDSAGVPPPGSTAPPLGMRLNT